MDTISIRGAREHNLKNIAVEIPRNKLVVITGVSGSGKSTLAFDVLYTEGRRRYVESLSVYARQFLAQRAKADVDSIDGLSPAVAIEQRRTTTSPRSTIGTVTEIADYLRLLYARVGTLHCLECGRIIETQSVPQIVDELLDLPDGTRLQLLAPIRLFHRDDFDVALQELRKTGFVRVRVNGTTYDLAEDIQRPRSLDVIDNSQLDVIIDRLVVKSGIAQRLADSLEMALRYGKDIVNVLIANPLNGEAEERLFTQQLICPACGSVYPELSPAFFSPNSPDGACSGCDGLGVQTTKKLSRKGKAARKGKSPKQEKTDSVTCAECQGRRLRPETEAIRVGDWSLGELSEHSIAEVAHFFTQLAFETQAEHIARPLCKDISARLQALIDLGLDYLTLDRPIVSLSGGEMQRARLATLLGNGLSEVVYILDEPSIGLHPRDTKRLLRILKQLRDQGNTVVVVEHDPETMLAADYIIDLGPGAGELGGYVCALGPPQEVEQAPGSLTGQYLSGKLTIPLPPHRRTSEDYLTLSRVTLHNLQGVTVAFPLGTLTCVTGVSGSGKSTLVMDALAPVLAHALAGSKRVERRIGELSGWQLVDKMIQVNQAPIGRTPSSNPATYIGLLNPLRELFAQLPEARMRGYGPNRFSFNVSGGRCEACEGNGVLTVEMNFLPDVYVTCDVCHGQRYNRDTLEIQFRGKNIAEVLRMTVAEALVVCGDIPKIRPRLETLREVGLEYLRLGQPAPSLSGGEAQRLKLAKELSRKTTGRTVYIFDEPTTGLHLADIRRLLDIFSFLVEGGNTVVVIEHNLEVVKTADFVIDLGPEGGEAGGNIIAIGTPEQIAQAEQSYTGRLLKGVLAQ